MIKKFSPTQPPITYERCAAHEEETDALRQLIAAIGPERFRHVQERFGGQRVWIPKPGCEQPCKRCPDRDRKIAKLRKEGVPVAELAERFGLSPKRIYGILENPRPRVLASASNGNCRKSTSAPSLSAGSRPDVFKEVVRR